MASLFISDLHLCAERPDISELFLGFLRDRVSGGDTLYILGDLFEVWLGDDAITEDQRAVVKAIRASTLGGAAAFFMHGNRDFLIGESFATMAGCQLLPESVTIRLGGQPVLLMHGDTLCTDDRDYQAFRAQVRNPAFIRQFLSMPIERRMAIAGQARSESGRAMQQKSMDIMDVNQQAVEDTMRRHGIRHLIHGHTHRQAMHEFPLDGEPARRTVLGDWHRTGSVLIHDENGFRMENFGRLD
jgi:UDP-2,3-diacylglucosamine hydrolase